jgi:glycosyltransferase involved in cell wall biosynthesis
MRLGVVIPCYKPHLPKLVRLLESIAVQTVAPDCVIVACSSTTVADAAAFSGRAMEVIWVLSPNRRNAAENRNTGISVALARKMDAVTFIDADDIMHPQRCEALHMALNGRADIILHDYWDSPADLARPFTTYREFPIEYNCLVQAPSGCAIHLYDWGQRVHHSQVTVTRRVLERMTFPEGTEYERREDSVFCGNALSMGFRNAYLPMVLSKYDEAGFWVSDSGVSDSGVSDSGVSDSGTGGMEKVNQI